ncbi:MAG: OmpL47-type beta-barrel domain-containing protein [Elusimicrobiota bacterium]
MNGLSQVVESFGPSAGGIYSPSLSSLQNGTTVYFVATDAYGNQAVQSVIIDSTGPQCNVGYDSITCNDNGPGLCQMSEEDKNTGQTYNQPITLGANSYTVSFSQFPLDGEYTDPAVSCDGNQAPDFSFLVQRDQTPPNDSSLESLSSPWDSLSLTGLLPGDPNEMFGPQRQVEPDQTLSYTVQFENEGDGTAYGVYATDVLDPSLDPTTLFVGNFQAINFVAGSTVPTSYPYNYDPTTRTITIMPGTIGPSQGGEMTISVKVKSGVAQGTVITNQATVYFPTVSQVTPTNEIVSVVPIATQLVYTGSTTASFADQAILNAQLVTSTGAPIPGELVNYSVDGTTASATTTQTGSAYAQSQLELTPSTYTLSASFPGDGFYYLSSTQTTSFGQTKASALLAAPFASSAYPGTANLTLTMTGDTYNPLLNQAQNPKTIYLAALQNGTWQTLAESVLSGTTVQFSFPMFKPSLLTTPIRAQFEGDSDYNPIVSSTGSLVLLDTAPPAISIQSPPGGIFSGNQLIPVKFQVSDSLDPAPISSAVFQSLITGSTIAVSNGADVPATELSTGTWVLNVTAVNWAGYTTIVQSSSFTILTDIQPPRTSLGIGPPDFTGASSATFVTSHSSMTLSSMDDLISVGDDQGLGVAFQELIIDSGTPNAIISTFTNPSPAVRQTFVSTFTLAMSSDGFHTLDYFAQDIAGNREAVHIATVAVDNTPPIALLSILGSSATLNAALYAASGSSISLSAIDPVVNGVASGVGGIQLTVDGSTQSYSAPFALSAGTHALAFSAYDNVGNQSIISTQTVIIDTQAPSISILSPSTGTYIANQSTITISFSVADAFDVSPSSAAALIELTHSGGPITSSTEVAVSNGEEISPLSLDQGTWELQVQASNFVHNSTTAFSGPFTIIHDIQPPRTSLAISSPDFVSASSLTYVTDRSSMTLSSIDDLISTGDALGLGVAYQEIVVDSGLMDMIVSTFTNPSPAVGQTFVSTFTLSASSDGIHTLDYFAQDIVGNREVVHVTTVAVDNTPPETELSFIGGAESPGPVSGSVYVSSSAFLALVSTDPVINGAASGVAFTQYSDNGGLFQIYTSSFALAPGAHSLDYQSQDNVGNLEVLRSTIVLVDQTPPVASLVISSPSFAGAEGIVYVASSTFISLTALDPPLVQISSAPGVNGPGPFPSSGVNRIEVAVDSQAFAAYVSSVSLGQGLSQGLHILRYYAVDNVGNVEAVQTSTIAVDLTPPISSLSIGQPSFALSSSTVLVSSTTPLVVLSTDPVVDGVASGVSESFVAIGTGPFHISTGAFTLSEFSTSPYVVRFYSVDNVGNQGIVQSSNVILAETPPSLALFSPAQNSTGIAAIVSGQAPILGSVFDLYLSSWSLSYAPGQNANAGFVFISSGSADVSSTTLSAATLGVWNATALSGWQTLLLTAQDLVGNTAAVSVSVYAGSPAELMALGNPQVFDMPEGVATDISGNIYVADTNASQIKVYTATGSLVAIYGDGRHDYDQEGNEIEFSTVVEAGGRAAPGALQEDASAPGASARFNHPRSIAVDQAGNMYVADTGNERIVKISSGGAVLLTIGKTDMDREHWGICESGPLPGQFNHPSGIALDQAGNIYVSDTLNHRVQVFSSSGTFILVFDLPPAESPDGGKRGELKPDAPHWVDWAGDWDDRAPLGNPAGIAVDQAGDIFVADAKGGRGLEFSSTGYLLLTVPISEAGVLLTAQGGNSNGNGHGPNDGHTMGQGHDPELTLTARPYGIAVSPDGSRIYISDARSSRILDFDALGDQILAFGSRGHIPDNKAPPANIVFDKPAGLALAPDGTLLAADRNNDRIERFGLPNGQPMLVIPPPRPRFNKISDVVDYDIGGDISRSDDAGVKVPPGAINEDMQLSVSTVTPSDMAQMNAMMQTAQKNGAQPVYPPVDYEPEGTLFARPVTLTLPYNPDLVAQAGLPQSAVQVNYWNPATQQWQPLQSTVDPSNHTVTAQTSHFSLYQVLTSTTVTPLALIPANSGATVFNVYNFPNPFDLVSKTVTTINGAGAQTVRGTMIAISLPPDISGGGEIKIFNIAGHRVKTIALGSLHGGNYYYQEWDGTDDDGRDVASGVYIGDLKVGGQSKTFKMAMIKGSGR